MYEKFYGFEEKPFSLLPDPSFLYLGKQHSMAYSMFEYGLLNQAGFTVVSGEIGCGKTTLIRHLLNQLPMNLTVGLISNTHQSFGQLLQWVLLAFGLDYKGKENVELHEVFCDFLIKEYAKGRRTVLIIDEAQNLTTETLEELRMLSNINADKYQVLQLILVGQPQLKQKLSQPELEQFTQRIAVDYHLRALSEEETIKYIGHRVLHAGGSADLFTVKACKKVYQNTKGTPRLINVLCDTALVYGYAESAVQIDDRIVNNVIEDKKESLAPRQVAEKENQPEVKDSQALDDSAVMAFAREMAEEFFSRLRKK